MMTNYLGRLGACLAACTLSSLSVADDLACRDAELALQVLGSGGPIADDERASSGYLLWHEGRAVLLIEAGGGVFQRFGAAGATIDGLELIAITHFHTDHSADLPALLKGAYFSTRERELPISGPTGRGPFPPLTTFLERLFAADSGAFAYLSGLLEGSRELPPLAPVTVDHTSDAPQRVIENDAFTVHAVGVPHGPVPALGYLITVGDRKIAISGDQNLSSDAFTRMIHAADVFVMPMAVPQTRRRPALHARPSDIGRAAATAEVGKLVLSHWMARSLADQAGNIAIVKTHYDGPVVAAEDLLCLPL